MNAPLSTQYQASCFVTFQLWFCVPEKLFIKIQAASLQTPSKSSTAVLKMQKATSNMLIK